MVLRDMSSDVGDCVGEVHALAKGEEPITTVMPPLTP